MIIKELSPPLMLILLEILKSRICPGHVKIPEIERDLAKRWAGFWGELALANYVKQLPQDQYTILHDLQLKDNNTTFQIDTLLITNYFILIIEAKNIIGTLIFDNAFNQLIRLNSDGSEECFEDPRVQCRRLQSLLKKWLIQNRMNVLPIETLIFFKSTNTILKTNSPQPINLSRISKGRDVFNKIHEIVKLYPHEKIDEQTRNKLGKLLLKKHSTAPVNILEKYKLTQEDLTTGFRCQLCSTTPVSYHKGKWYCQKCEAYTKVDYMENLNDFFQLIHMTITNSEFRHFFHFPNSNTAQKALSKLPLKTSGKTRNRIYHPPKEQVIPCVLLTKLKNYSLTT